MGVSGEYFTTSKRIDDEGNDVEFENGESFSRVEGSIQGLYGLTENLQIGGGIRFRQNSSTLLNTTTGEEESESSSGVESTFANFTFAFKPINRMHYTLEGLFRFRPFTNDEGTTGNTGSLILGDDGNEYSAGLGVTYAHPGNNFLTGRVGYRNPGTDLSSEIYWQIEGALAWRYVALVAGVDGINSLGNSPYEGKPQERPLFNTGGTNLYNSINREMITPYAGLNFALGKNWRVELRGSQVVSGKSTDIGTAFGVSLIRRVEDKSQDRPDQRFKEYDFEAAVTKVSQKKKYVVIDKGLADDVAKGMKIDFYEFDYVGGNILLARGIVLKTKSDSSIVKITNLYNRKKELKEGVVARGSFK